MDPATSFGSSTWRAALTDAVDHGVSLNPVTTDAELEKKRQQQSVMKGAQMLPEKSQQAMCGVTEEAVEVMVYKILTRLASNGRMAADCGNGPQHISDVNSDVAESSKPVEQFGDVPGGECQIGDSHTADDVSDSHTGEVDVLVQENALQDDALLVQENGMYDDIVPNMKRNDVLLVPRQQRGHKRGRRRQQKIPLWQQPDPDFDMCFPFF